MVNSKTIYEISVVIPTYNRGELLRYTLDSLLQQTVAKKKFEVIIGDDGSSDNTREIVRAYEGLMNVKYVFQEDKGYRPASVRNKAIRLSEGKICLFIDASVILDKHCIEEHIRFHGERKSSACAIGYVYGFDHDEESEELLMSLVLPSDPENSIKRLSQHKVFFDVREGHYNIYNDKLENLPAPWYYFWTCHLSVALKDLLRVGLFDEKYDGRWGVEDNDLGLRLHQSNVNICLLRSAKSIHYPHGKNKAERQIEGYENCVYFHGKFNTLETGLFLKHYKDLGDGLTDINAIALRLSSKQPILDSLVS